MRKRLPFELEIAKPCREPWQAMSGAGNERHCGSCNKNVHNLAAMDKREIVRLIEASDGHLCARVTRRADGSIVTTDSVNRGGIAAKAAGLLMGAALSAGAATAEGPAEPSMKAIVSGTVHDAKGLALEHPAEVWFVAVGQSVKQVSTDASGQWHAELAPGTYDVIVRNGPMFGERIKAVQLHSGQQSFAPLKERFNLGHLDVEDHALEESALVGEVIATYRYPVSYLFKHPLQYMKNLRHNFG